MKRRATIGILCVTLAMVRGGAAEALTVAAKALTSDACVLPSEQDYSCLAKNGCFAPDGSINQECAKKLSVIGTCPCSSQVTSSNLVVPVPTTGAADDAVARLGIVAAWAVRGTASVAFSVDGGKTYTPLGTFSMANYNAGSFGSFAASYRAAIRAGRTRGANAFQLVASGQAR